jgi:spore cortex formation protein SpoVR/YcgB (stage V sporulation)
VLWDPTGYQHIYKIMSNPYTVNFVLHWLTRTVVHAAVFFEINITQLHSHDMASEKIIGVSRVTSLKIQI